jgi:histidinol dehydrogenase
LRKKSWNYRTNYRGKYKIQIISSKEFLVEKNKFLNRGKTDLSKVFNEVKTIVDDVKKNGDNALLRYTKKFDNVSIIKNNLKVSTKEIEQAYKNLEEKQISALKEAAKNIRKFHKKQLKNKWTMEIESGVTIGQILRPLETVGIYTPGGKASYPSSTLMCAIPAKIAGVKKIILCSPPKKNGKVNPALIVAADIAGVDEFYKVGGAQAIAAMAYGTESIQAVNKIFGPGNVYVTAAKLEVNKEVAIDIPAGPSEVLVIADETSNPAYIASDLLAQAEHDPQASSILISTSKQVALSVKDQLDKQIKSLTRINIIKASLENCGLIITAFNLDEAIEIANMIAPEHLQIQTKSPNKVLNKIQNAGAIFLGKYSPVSFGDYSSGLNHVLPTSGYSRIYSGLTSLDFVKIMNFLNCTKQGLKKLKDTTVTIAKMEGFDAHAKAVLIRGEKENENI